MLQIRDSANVLAITIWRHAPGSLNWKSTATQLVGVFMGIKAAMQEV